jgi:hypothetical protein
MLLIALRFKFDKLIWREWSQLASAVAARHIMTDAHLAELINTSLHFKHVGEFPLKGIIAISEIPNLFKILRGNDATIVVPFLQPSSSHVDAMCIHEHLVERYLSVASELFARGNELLMAIDLCPALVLQSIWCHIR